MRDKTTRRVFLAAAGTSAALAGCMDRLEGITGGTSTGTEEPTDQPEPTDTPTQAPQDSTPFSRGEVVDDFEDMEQWGTVRGKLTADSENTYAGSQSARIENKSGGAAGIFKSFPDGLDLSKHDLSMAVKLEKPASGKVSVEFLAPGRSDHLVSKRFIPKPMDDWFRIDLGYTGKRGKPQMSSVQEVRILVVTDNKPVRYWVDDLRKTKKPDKGKAILTFDDAHITQYDVAFDELQKRNWPAAEFIIPDAINSQGNLTIGQLREMRDAGWDIGSHPDDGQPLTAFSKKKQRRLIKDSKQYLVQKGFDRGARFFAAPYNQINGATVELVEEFHEYGFTFGACPNATPPTCRPAISRVLARDLQGTRRVFNLADQFNQLAVLNFHAIGPDENISKQDFTHILDHLEKKDMDVITPSELLELEQQ